MVVTFERVKAGDLIKAGDWNELADAIEAMDVRLSALEGSPPTGPSGPGLQILDIDPDEPQELGVMSIIGRNFAVPGSQNFITLGNQPLTGILESNDKLLKVSVPGNLPGLPDDFVLQVEAGGEIASRIVRIRPLVVVPGGKPVITDVTTGVGVITIGDPFTFTFRIDASAVTIPETWEVEAIYTNVVGASEQAWKDATTYVNTTPDRKVTVNPATPVNVGVTVVVPSGATSVSLSLKATSVNNDPGSSQTSPATKIEVNVDQPDNDPRIQVVPGQMTGANLRTITDPATGGLVVQVRYPTTAATRQVLVPISVHMQQAGNYAYTADLENPGTLWTLGAVSPTSSPEGQIGSEDLQVAVRINTKVPASERRNLVVTATRQETTAPGQIASRLTVPIEGFSA